MFRTGAYVNADVLALAEVARRYPQTNFIAGFGGFADMWFELPGVFASLPNLLLDGSMMWGDAIREIVRDHGAARVLFASGEPRNRYAVNLRTLDRLDLDAASRRAILFGNAKRVFHV
jgi:predicted TIM-barrel fold metal-dependent hydrolase